MKLTSNNNFRRETRLSNLGIAFASSEHTSSMEDPEQVIKVNQKAVSERQQILSVMHST